MKSRLIVSAVIEKGEYLLFGRKKSGIGPYPNTWHLIGGGVDLDKETCRQAVLREIKEEARIKVRLLGNISFDEDYEKDKHGMLTHYVFLVYKAEYISGIPKAEDDIKELKWVPKAGLNRIRLSRPSTKLFRNMGYI